MRAGPTGSNFREKWPEVDWPRQFRYLSSLVIRGQVYSFFWLLWHCGLATNAWVAKRTGHGHSPACTHCGAPEKDIEHLFINCPAAQEMWNQLSTSWQTWIGVTPPVPSQETLTLSGPKPGYPAAYDTLVAHTLWSIWIRRNALQFQNEAIPCLTAWQSVIRCFVSSMAASTKRSKGSRQMWTPFGKWIDDSTLNWEATLSFLTGNARVNPLREESETD